MDLRSCVAAATCTLLVSVASADTIAVQLAGSHVEAIVSNGATVPHTDLRWGHSTGPVMDHPWATTIRSADGRNLQSYFIRNGVSGDWEVDLGSFTPSPGPAADFFLFEVGGNDSVSVRARMLDGSLGASVSVSGWSPTGVFASAGPNLGQQVHGLGIRHEQLRTPSGAPLPASQPIAGLVIRATGVDGAAFLVREDGVGAPVDGDGSAFVLPASPRALSPVQVTFRGPWASETSDAPNPFLDLRMTVRFTGPGGRSVVVPGFFDADGERGDAGNHWAARFLPPVAGSWTASVTMRRGNDVAASTNPNAGSRETLLDGRTFTFQVGAMHPDARGFFRVGTLQDVGKHHRKFEFGPYFLKAGTNSPENFLGIRCLDDATKSGGEGQLHSYTPHVQDWRPGDPVLDPGNVTDDGRGVIGALNYLEESGVNSLFMMVMNLGGDGLDVYPFVGPDRTAFDKTHYDTSRLRQWNTIFEHAQACGISLSLVMNETEIDNELWLDDGNLGVERKVFYRELVARFGHLPAVRWNVCEESDFSLARLDQFAGWIKSQDGHGHSIAIHNNPNDLALFQNLASNPNFDTASLQFEPNGAASQVQQVRAWTEQNGHPWVVDADEQGPWQTGLTDQNAADTRKRILYDALLSGGGVEFYMGYHDLPLGGDLNVEDFRTRDDMWQFVRHARTFIEGNLPFWDMSPQDALVTNENGSYGGAEVFALPGEVYAIYFPNASSTGRLDLQGYTGNYRLEWFNPRLGRFEGNVVQLGTGGGQKTLPAPPNSPSEDWLALVRPSRPFIANRASGSVSAQDVQVLAVRAGTPFAGRSYFLLSSFTGPGAFLIGGIEAPIPFDRLTRYGINDAQGLMFQNRTGVLDASGGADMSVRLTPQVASGLVGFTLNHVVVTLGPTDWVSNVVSLQVLP